MIFKMNYSLKYKVIKKRFYFKNGFFKLIILNKCNDVRLLLNINFNLMFILVLFWVVIWTVLQIPVLLERNVRLKSGGIKL